MKSIKHDNYQQFITAKKLNNFLFLFLSWSLAIAVPIMNLFGKQPVFIIAHEIRGWSMVLSILVLNFIPPLIFWFVTTIVGFLSSLLKEWLSRIIIVLLMTLFFLSFVTDIQHRYAVLIAVILAITTVYLLIKLEAVKTFAMWFAPASLIFILQFLFFSDAKQLLPKTFEIKNISTAQSSTPIYIFILDELPLISLLNDQEKIDPQRFPTLANFSQSATWYPNATAISSATDIALPSILSGILPEKKTNTGSFEQYPQNLFTLFSPTHTIHAIENTTRMCPSFICKAIIDKPYQLLIEDVAISYLYTIYPKDKLYKLPPINDRWIGFMRELKNESLDKFGFSERKNTFMKFINNFHDYPDNTLHFLHILLPHAPWRILPDLKLYGFYENDGTPGELNGGTRRAETKHQWNNDLWATQLSWRKHLLQVGAVDKLLQLALDEIKQLKQYDQATIIITADHGSSFIPEYSRRYAHDENIPDIAAIPLFIKYPNQKMGTVDLRHASNIDIVSTLLDTFSFSTDQKISGISLKSQNLRAKAENIVQEGGIITKIPENYKQLYAQRLLAKNNLFSKPGWNGIYHPQGSDTFFNMDVSSLEIKNTHKNAIKMMNANLFENIVYNSNYIPAYYRLKVLTEIPELNEILVAVNNKIVSHCFIFKHKKTDCAGIINPEIYSNHDNLSTFQFRFFSVHNSTNKVLVDELLVKQSFKATLANENNQESIKFESGESKPINTKSDIYGTASIRKTNNGSTYEISGWAGNTITGEIADKIYLFVDDELYTNSELGLPKKYLADLYGYESLINSGYQITIPIEQFPLIQNRRIRVFAGSKNNEATELNYHKNKTINSLFSTFDTQNNRIIPKNNSSLLLNKSKNMQVVSASSNILFDAFNQESVQNSTGDWYTIKKHTRWIGSSVSFVFLQDDSTNQVNLKITAKPLIKTGLVDKQNVFIYVNDVKVKSLELINRASIEINIDTKAGQATIIRLEMPNAISPASIKQHKDKRKLSLFVSEFLVEKI